MPELVTVAEAVGRTIAQLGATHVFGVVGSGNFYATNGAIHGGVPFTATRHEMGAACMADAYSRATGKVAVVTVHQGCGLTNAMTGITEAAKCHSRVLVISGDTRNGNVTSNFYIDQDAAVRALGAVAERIHSARTAIADAARAFITCAIERKTVVLSMPIDIQEELTEWDESLVPPLPERAPAGPSEASVQRIADLLQGAQRPVIVGGRGAWHAREELSRLAELSGALLITSAAGRGTFAGHEWALDIMGGFATDGSAELVGKADVMVAFGAGLNDWTTRNGTLLRDKTVVQVDDRLDAIGWHNPVDVGVVGDSALTATAVADELERRGVHQTGYRTPDTADRVAKWRYWSDVPYEPRIADDRVDPQAFSNALDRLLPLEGRIVVPDGGNFNCYPGAHLRVPDQLGYVVPLSFQSIGLALSSAIGAAVALPGRLPVVGVGDGGFMMTHVELDTAVRLGLGMIVAIYDDNAYGAEVHVFEDETDELDTVRFPDTDLAAIARGYGCDALTVRSLDDLAGIEQWLAGPRNRPLVLDVKVIRFRSWVLAHAHSVEKVGQEAPVAAR